LEARLLSNRIQCRSWVTKKGASRCSRIRRRMVGIHGHRRCMMCLVRQDLKVWEQEKKDNGASQTQRECRR
jgi:hypothetical protein